MGVDFYPCSNCGDTFPDCGPHVRCNDWCGRVWCSDDCAAEDGFEEPDGYDSRTCSYCRLESAEDGELLRFLLTKYKLSRTEIETEYLAQAKKALESNDDSA